MAEHLYAAGTECRLCAFRFLISNLDESPYIITLSSRRPPMQDAQMIVSRWKQPPIDMQFGLRKVRADTCDGCMLLRAIQMFLVSVNE